MHLGDDALIETWFDGLGESFLEGAEEICGAAFAEILVRRGRTRDAERVLHRTIAVTERQRGNVMTLLAAARFAAPEDADRARAQLVAADAPNELVERHALALFDAYAAVRAGNTKAAEPLARRAAEGFGRLGFPLLEAVAREACGEVERARELYRACGAVGDLRRLERVAHIGSVRATSGRSAAPGGALSKRERQVVTLVANGSSNKAVAERLDISVKTVEKHLGAAYRKIGITSRSRLVDHLVESDAG